MLRSRTPAPPGQSRADAWKRRICERGKGGRSAGRAAVIVVFVINGIGYGNWVARIPSIRDELRLDTQSLRLALLGVAIGSLLGLPVSGVLVARFGSRRMTTVASNGRSCRPSTRASASAD